MLLNCGVGEDSWEYLVLQGDQTSQSWRKSVLNSHWKDWCWSWSSNTLATWCKELTHWKRLWCRVFEDWRQEEKGTTEDEMVGWHHWLNGHEFEQGLGVGHGQGTLVCCSSWGHKKLDMTECLNWTEYIFHLLKTLTREKKWEARDWFRIDIDKLAKIRDCSDVNSKCLH